MGEQSELNRQFSEDIASLKARYLNHETILEELKEGAKDMVKAINQIKYVLIVFAIGVFINGGPLADIIKSLFAR